MRHDNDMIEWHLRPADKADAGAIADCLAAAYADYRSRIPDLPAVSEGVEDHIERDHVWVAEIEDEIVGALIVVPDEEFVLLANVAVHPDQRGKGLGRALIGRAEADCLELGLREVRLRTHADIPENIGLYSRLGWRETSREGNIIHMKKVLLGGRWARVPTE